MAVAVESRPRSLRFVTVREWSDPAYQAYKALHVIFTIAPIIAGLDKFFHLLTGSRGRHLKSFAYFREAGNTPKMQLYQYAKLRHGKTRCLRKMGAFTQGMVHGNIQKLAKSRNKLERRRHS